MKTFLNKFPMIVGLFMILMSACKKDEQQVFAAADATPAALDASATQKVLKKAEEQNTAITFDFTKPDFGFQAQVNNTLQLAKKDNNFSTVKEIGIGLNEYSKTFTVLDFNSLLLSMGLPTNTNTTIQARIKSQISPDVFVYSNVVDVTVNPYPLISFVYVPGDYQGWNPSTADSLISPVSNGIYSGIINFPATAGATFQFKITPAKSWSVAYGNAGAGKISTTAGDNLKVPSAGMYKLTVNLNDMTFQAERYSWAIIGNATPSGWDADTDMMYNNGTRTWSITTNLTVGELKFRLNDDWATNYGGANGVLAAGGANIAVTSAGSYKITFNPDNNSYSLTKL